MADTDGCWDATEAEYNLELSADAWDLEPAGEGELRHRYHRERRAARGGLRVPSRPMLQSQARRHVRRLGANRRCMKRVRSSRRSRRSRRRSTTRPARGDPEHGDGPSRHPVAEQAHIWVGDKSLERSNASACRELLLPGSTR